MDASFRMKPWPKLGSKILGDFRIFRLAEEEFLMPDGRTHKFFVLLSPDWVNVVPITPQGRVVLIRQFRPGTCEVTIEVPGGMVDRGEEPSAAARRELEEETGYTAEKIVLTGMVRPNPAFLNNTCHMFVALQARPLGKTRMDEAEDVEAFEATFDEVDDLIAKGAITHSLVLNTLTFARKALESGLGV